eukprot:COSAG06_NODE_5671_length_3331_cov_1.614790_4_plen_187_part_00
MVVVVCRRRDFRCSRIERQVHCAALSAAHSPHAHSPHHTGITTSHCESSPPPGLRPRLRPRLRPAGPPPPEGAEISISGFASSLPPGVRVRAPAAWFRRGDRLLFELRELRPAGLPLPPNVSSSSSPTSGEKLALLLLLGAWRGPPNLSGSACNFSCTPRMSRSSSSRLCRRTPMPPPVPGSSTNL